jgi:hypothetical protein
VVRIFCVIPFVAPVVLLGSRMTIQRFLPCLFFSLITVAFSGVSTPILRVDVNERGSDTNLFTEAGFQSLLLTNVFSDLEVQTNATVRSFGPYTVTLSGTAGTMRYDDRLRTTPVNTNAFTEARLLQDFAFGLAGGLDLKVEGLISGQTYRVTLWSFDTGSAGRVSDWYANGIKVRNNYAFPVSQPAANTDRQFSFVSQASDQGAIVVEGRADGASASTIAVFLNAFQLEETVVTPPNFVAQPVDTRVYEGERYALSANVTGTPPVSLQWVHDGVPLSGATNLTLTVTNALPEASGAYRLIASDIGGVTTSEVATLTVDPASMHTQLLAHWPLNETDGLTTPDVVGTNDLELVNLDTNNLVIGQEGLAFMFDGVDEILVAPIDPDGPLSLGHQRSYTVMLWVMGVGTNQNDRRVFSQGSSTDDRPLFNLGTHATAANASADLYVRTNTGGVVPDHTRSVQPAFDGQWHHVAFVFEPGYARMYIDGMLDGRTISASNANMTLDRVSVGGIMRAAGSHYFQGAIDEVVLYGRALRGDEVRTFMTLSVGQIQILRIEDRGFGLRLQVPFVSRGTYAVAYKERLDELSWTPVPLAGLDFMANGDIGIDVSTPAVPGGYFRVTVDAP